MGFSLLELKFISDLANSYGLEINRLRQTANKGNVSYDRFNSFLAVIRRV